MRHKPAKLGRTYQSPRLKWKGTRQTKKLTKRKERKSSKTIRSLQTAIRCGARKLYGVWKVKIEKTAKKKLNVGGKMRNPESLTRSSSLIPEVWLWKNIESQAECERPIYDQEKLKKGEDEQKTFHPVKEPSDFWKLLWEQEGSGDPSAPWLGVVREAIKENVSKPREDGFTFEYMSARKVITTKNNWSAPWPEKIANFFTPAPPPKKMVPNPFSYIQVIRYRRSAIC